MATYNLKDIMTRAHRMASQNAKLAGGYVFALKVALAHVWSKVKSEAIKPSAYKVAIKNAYSIKDSLKAMGAKWDAASKAWVAMSDSRAAEYAAKFSNVSVVAFAKKSFWNEVVNEGGEGYQSTNW